MKWDEFAFMNQQLAGMLKSGVPLEGALQRLAAEMQDGRLRRELERLKAELADGAPLEEALTRRDLPELYKRIVRLGAKGNDLPGVLLLMADYYRRMDFTWTRLKGLMVYPVLVLAAALVLSGILAFVISSVAQDISMDWFDETRFFSPGLAIWFPPVLMTVLLATLSSLLAIPAWRQRVRWRLPGFREAALAQLASILALLLERGATLQEALALVGQLEPQQRVTEDLKAWLRRVEEGAGQVRNWAVEQKVIPPLFVWLVTNGGENLAAGFARAAEIYAARAGQKIDLMLYAFLPVSVLALGLMIVGQLIPVLRVFLQFTNLLGSCC